ncbi:unnamed protein product [Tuber aestivum]|uniref:SRCR domain-containing protein n=1 Tax=Tuber aestivum TaxID=59557 RepID=A0A292PQF7_9PEZI|nr:unnamed protein product [Tuber aestivum]
MKFTLITAGLFTASSILTTGASPHNRRRGQSECGIGLYGGTVSEIPEVSKPPNRSDDNDGAGMSDGSRALYNAGVETPTATTATDTPAATPIVIKREVQHLGGSHRGHGMVVTHSEEGEEEREVDMLVSLLNHSFEHEHLRIGGECSPKQKKGCAGNSLVECGSEGVWELVTDCEVPGLDLVCRAVRERDIWKGGWAANVICLESDLVE